jgi:hypothetical protein
MNTHRIGIRVSILALSLAVLAASLGPLPVVAQADTHTVLLPVALSGLVRVERTSVFNSLDKSITADCPPGTLVVGAGGTIYNGNGEVLLGAIVPLPGLRSVLAKAYEADTYTTSWKVTAIAMCAQNVPGLVRVQRTSITDSLDKTAVANCPLGKFLLGMGYEINNGFGSVLAENMIPIAFNLGVTVQAREEDVFSSNWSVTAIAICSDPSVGARPFYGEGSRTSNDKSKTVTCPAGWSIVGAGYSFPGSTGEVVLDDLFLSTNKTAVTITGLEADPYADSWFIRVWAICVPT